jgi:hypothetical protein
MKLKFLFLTLLGVFIANTSNAQDVNPLGQKANRYISTGVPFLMISPDARASAMGDVGVSSSPDVYSMHWNPAKYAFIKNDIGIGISYSPWLKQLIPDLNLYSLNFYKRIDDEQTFAASLLYFSLGDVNFTNTSGHSLGTFRPNEFSFDVAYARKLSENFSAAIAARFIYSDLTQGQRVSGVKTKAGTSIAADISIYWRKEVMIGRSNGLFSFGVNMSNIGAKISYSSTGTKNFLPTNLRFGPSLMIELDRYNTLTLLLDINKLLVPTPPIRDENGNVVDGKEDNISVAQGIFQSFFDAPGGFSEELKEFQISFGAEYWYDKQFALRAGYFYESAEKGNRKYFTVGAGLKYNVFGLDFSYLIPTSQQHPLENTLRFSLLFDFGASSKNYRRRY